MINKERLIELFTKYGYDVASDKKDEKYMIFSSGTSMYPAVEIVKLAVDCDNEIEEERKNYSEAGYAVRICNEENIEEIEHYLFNWFFQVKDTNSRIRIQYDDYAESIMRAYVTQGANDASGKYSYIEIPYNCERDFEEKKQNIGLLNDIRADLKETSPQLIIIEAGAGFGKTSTVYEILKDYENVTENVRPFFMELSKDRTASNFRYLLLSQIDKNFKVRLDSEIVLYNIKRGYIPLIIDGFDELLSKDLDNGQMDAKFEKVETMLSTIAELLMDNAKVILTTRKTAIFAGESFYEWYTQLKMNGYNFKISRYQLQTPSINDWLPKDRVDKLPSNFEKISNPVLLGYLRYLDDKTFLEAVHSDSLIRHYIESILDREIVRQDLPFNKKEQVIILRRLAAFFAGFDMSSCSRSDLKDTFMETSNELLKDKATSQRNVENLSNTLANHAFLDRKNDTSIGFINDFILGVFLMYSITDETDNFYDDFLKGASYSMLEKSIVAASIFNDESRNNFWLKLEKRCTLNKILEFWSDVLLLDHNSHSYSNISLDGRNLEGVKLGFQEYPIKNCSFSNMDFIDCTFDFNYINDCAFINCRFKSCGKVGNNNNCGFYGCTDLSNSSFIDNFVAEVNVPNEKSDDEYMHDLLRLYFQVDEKTTKMKMISRIKDTFDNAIFKKIFQMAMTNKYIKTNGDMSFITRAGIIFYNEKKYE